MGAPAISDVYDALRQAHAAGDTASAQRLVDYIRSQTPSDFSASPSGPQDVPAFPSQASDEDDQQREIQTGAGLRGAGLAAMNVAGAAIPGAGPGAGILARMGIGALTGGALGAGSGAITAGDGNRGMGATYGGATGAFLGAVSPPLGSAAGAFIRLLRPSSGPGAGQAAALAAAQRAMQADGTTPAQLQSALATARASGQPMAPVDVGGTNLGGLVRATVTQPGPGRQITTANLQSRTGLPSQARIGGFARDVSGNPTRADVTAAYDRASPQELDDPALQQLLESYKPFASAHAEAIGDEAALAPPPPLFDATTGKLTRTPTVRDVDVIQKIMKARTDALKVPGTANPALVPGLLDQSTMRGQMMDMTDQLSPDYADARAIAQRQIGLREINNTLAQTANRNTQDFATPIIGGFPTSERAAALRDQFPGNPDGVQTFIQQLQNEQKMRNTNITTFGNSSTPRQLADSEDLDGAAIAGDAMHVAASPASGLLAIGLKKASGAVTSYMNSARNAALASGLTDTSVGGQADAFLQQLDQVEAARSATQISGDGPQLAPAFAAMGGAATGQAVADPSESAGP